MALSKYTIGPQDLERGNQEKQARLSQLLQTDEATISNNAFTEGNSAYAKLQRFAGKYKIEQRGIERVPEDERTDKSLTKAGTMWLSANMVVSTFAVGALAVTVFHLGFVDSLLTIIFINLLAITPVAFFSTFGPRYGLRQIILSRYYFGFQLVKIVAIFNILACIGWSAVNVIVGAQLLNAVSSYIPGYAGIIITAAVTFIVTLFGYEAVHYYESYSWIPSFIVFLIVIGEFARSGAFQKLPMGVGDAEIGSVLSFAASVFGFGTGWTSFAADYTVYQPATVSRVKVFVWTYGGLIFPLLFTEILGLAVATAYVPASTPGNVNPYYDGYKSSGVGGLLAAVLVPPLGRFGDFCLVILALSIIASNCPNIYSLTFSLQIMGQWTQVVPRFLWTLVGTVVYCAIAIPGYSHFESVLENFMLLIGYWLSIYTAISLTEHFLFHPRPRRYDPQIYTSPALLPPGIAATLAFALGVAGAVLGMAQVWFIGPIGGRIGLEGFGGDVGFECAFGFAGVAYAGLRSVERRVFGR